MTLSDSNFDIDGIECTEALYLYDGGDGRHAMAYIRLLEDEWNDETGYCWCHTTYIFEGGSWIEYGGDRSWDYDRADEFAPAEADLPYEILDSSTSYLYADAAAYNMYEDLIENQRDFASFDLAQAIEII